MIIVEVKTLMSEFMELTAVELVKANIKVQNPENQAITAWPDF